MDKASVFEKRKATLKQAVIKYLSTCKDKKCPRDIFWNEITNFQKKPASRKYYGVSKMNNMLSEFSDVLVCDEQFVCLRDVIVISDSDEEDSLNESSTSSTFATSKQQKKKKREKDKHLQSGTSYSEFQSRLISILQSENGKCRLWQFTDKYTKKYGICDDMGKLLRLCSDVVIYQNDELLLRQDPSTSPGMSFSEAQASSHGASTSRIWGSGLAAPVAGLSQLAASGSSHQGMSSQSSSVTSLNSDFISFSGQTLQRAPQNQGQTSFQRYGLGNTGQDIRPSPPRFSPNMIPQLHSNLPPAMRPPNSLPSTMMPPNLSSMRMIQVPQNPGLVQFAPQRPPAPTYFQSVPQGLPAPTYFQPVPQDLPAPVSIQSALAPPHASPLLAPQPPARDLSEWPRAMPKTGPPPGTKIPNEEKDIVVRPIILPRGTRLMTEEVEHQVDECIDILSEAREHVSKERLESLIVQKYQVRNFQQLGLPQKHFDQLKTVNTHNLLLGKVNAYIQNFVRARSLCTLYELKECCREFHPEGKDFYHLRLGPLQKMPMVYDLFKFPLDEYIPEITSVDILEHLRNYLDRSQKWTARVAMEEFMTFLVDNVYQVTSGYSLGIRLSSLPLCIMTMKKSQRDAASTRRLCIEQLRESVNADVKVAFDKFKASVLQTSQDQTAELRLHYLNLAPEDAIREILSKFELLAEILAQSNKFQKHFENFINTILNVPLPRMLFHLSICMSDLRILSTVDEFLELRKRREQQALEQKQKEQEQTQRRVPPTKDALIEKTVIYLNKFLEHGSLQLSNLQRIESRILEDYNFVSFQDMGYRPFLDFILSESKIRAILDESGGTMLGSSSSGYEAESMFKPSHVELLELICQSKHAGVVKNQQAEAAICEQYQVTDVKNLSHGNIGRLCSAADKPGKHASRQYHVLFETALCGKICPSTRISGSVGMQGSLTKEAAMACLTACPLLEDMAEWSHWSLVFHPQHGHLRTFIEKYGGQKIISLEGGHKEAISDFCALEVEPGKFLKLYSQSTPEDFQKILEYEDPLATAGVLVSLIAVNKGLENTPLALLSNYMKARLISLHARSTGFPTPGGPPLHGTSNTIDLAVHFVTLVLLRLPVRVCVSIANKVLLEPLSQVVGSAKSKSQIVQACTLPGQRQRLELLGCLLGLPEWSASMKSRHEFLPAYITVIGQDDLLSPIEQDQGQEEEEEVEEEDSSEESDSDILSGENETPEDPLGLKDEEVGQQDGVEVADSEACREGGDKNADDDDDVEKGDKEDEDDEEEEKDKKESSSELKPEVNDSIEKVSESEVKEIDETFDENIKDSERELREPTRVEICHAIVDSICREEFGVGIHLDETGQKLMQKQQERQGRSLLRLSKDLYSKDTHFVLELIQNADDNSYSEDTMPAVKFVIDFSGVMVLNNEQGFEEKNIRALCDVGKSTKSKHQLGYIGQKGIGFKSVFRVTSRPEVHSNGFHICFDVNSGPMGYILPYWIDQYEDNRQWQTSIVLPWTEEIKQNIQSHAARFNDITPSLLLFLHRLKEITIENKVEGCTMFMQRQDLPDGEIQISHSFGTDRWLVLRKALDASTISLQMKSGIEVDSTEIALAFPLKDKAAVHHSQVKPEKLPVFAFLPLRSYGFRFIVQGDFDVPSSREDVDRDSSWNQWLRNEIHVLFIEALEAFKARLDLSPVEALILYLQFIPMEGEVMEFFKPVSSQILSQLRALECMPVLTGNKKTIQWKMPSKTVVAHDALVLEIVSPELLQHHMGLHYLHPQVAAVMDTPLIQALGVESVTTEHLLQIGQSIGQNWNNSGGKDQVTELAKWLACVYRSLDDFQDNKHIIETLTKMRVMPLSSGALVALADVTVFLLTENNQKPALAKDKKNKGSSRDPIQELKKDLNLVHTELTATSDDEINSQVTKLLIRMGIKQITAHDLVHSHILPILKSEQWKEKSEAVLVSYVVYIKTELAHNSSLVNISELKNVIRLLTNHGMKSPCEDDIHFPTEFGNTVDLLKDFPGMNWTFVDSAYIVNCSPQEIQSWRDFFLHLGVENFLRVKKTEVHINKSNIHETAWAAYKEIWPDSPDGYVIVDYQCEEFHRLVTANTRQDSLYNQMISLYKIMDKEWNTMYSLFTATQLKSSSGHVLKEIQSSFAIYLQTLQWIPSIWRSVKVDEGSTEVDISDVHALQTPAELYVLDRQIEDLLAHTVKYLKCTHQRNSNFISFLKIKCNVNVETVKKALISWCERSEDDPNTPKCFSTSMNHVYKLYTYLSENMAPKDSQDLFHHYPAIFVPDLNPDKCNLMKILTGTMYDRKEVWWSDPTGLLTKYQESLELYRSPLAKRRILQHVYQPLKEMFERVVRVDFEPSTLDLANLLKHIAAVKLLTDADVVADTLLLFSNIGLDLSKIDQTEAGVKTPEAHKAQTNLPLIQELLTKAAVFPTKQCQWVSLTDHPMISDSEEFEEMFGSRPGVHILQLQSGTYRERGTRTRGVGSGCDPEYIQHFLSLFEGIQHLSECIKSEEITSGFQQCIKGQDYMHKIVGPLQKYLYFTFPKVYDQVKEKKAGCFKELLCVQVVKLEVKYELSHRPDVYEIREEKCIVKDKYFYFHEKYMDSLVEINKEIAKYFSEGDVDCMRDLRLKPQAEKIVAEGRSTTEQIFNLRMLCEKYQEHQQDFYHVFIDFKRPNFLSQLVTILDGKSDETIDGFMSRQRIPAGTLPSEEEVWEIPLPVIPVEPEPEPEPEPEEKEVEEKKFRDRGVSGAAADGGDGGGDAENSGLKSWPPKSSLIKDQTAKPRKMDGEKLPSGIWPPPQAPSYATTSKHLPSNIRFERVEESSTEKAGNVAKDGKEKMGPPSKTEGQIFIRQTSQASEAGDGKSAVKSLSHAGDRQGVIRQASHQTGDRDGQTVVHRQGQGQGGIRQVSDGEARHGEDRGHGSGEAGDESKEFLGETRKRKLAIGSAEENAIEFKRLNSQERDAGSDRQVEGANREVEVKDKSQKSPEGMEEEEPVNSAGSSSRETTPTSSNENVKRQRKKGPLQFTIPAWSDSNYEAEYTELARGESLNLPPELLTDKSMARDIGQWGEILVLDYLINQKNTNSQIEAVLWANVNGEKGLPYDFEIVYKNEEGTNFHSVYIEVKATISWDKAVFHVSSNQIEFALQHKDQYEIYRVYGAGNKNTKLVRVDNVADKLKTKAVHLFMVL